MDELVSFYQNAWHGTESDPEALPVLLSRAADIVDGEICLSGETVANISEPYKTAVYKAVCAQADYITANGGVEALSEEISGGSVSLGSFSYSGGSSSSGGAVKDPRELCGLSSQYLKPTGLLYRGVNCRRG